MTDDTMPFDILPAWAQIRLKDLTWESDYWRSVAEHNHQQILRLKNEVSDLQSANARLLKIQRLAELEVLWEAQDRQVSDYLAVNGYPTLSAWMLDSDYHQGDDGEWYDEDGNGPYDPTETILGAIE